MPLVFETATGEDLDVGTGAVTKTSPAGGTQSGTQISLTTFCRGGAAGSATTATWDPASVLAAQSVTTTVTVSGAQLGDFVLISASIDLGGCTLFASVTSSSTVTVVLSNPTTAAVDLGSMTLKVAVANFR